MQLVVVVAEDATWVAACAGRTSCPKSHKLKSAPNISKPQLDGAPFCMITLANSDKAFKRALITTTTSLSVKPYLPDAFPTLQRLVLRSHVLNISRCEMSETVSSNQTAVLDPVAAAAASPDREKMEANVVQMQQQLSGILDVVDEMRRNCARLQSENRFIQEYIESLMIKRRTSESN